MTKRYAHLTNSHLDDAIRSMNEKRFGIQPSSKDDETATNQTESLPHAES